MKMRSVCFVVYGLDKTNCSLQPWRYLTELSRQLDFLGHRVTILTDRSAKEKDAINSVGDVTVKHLRSVRNFIWRENAELSLAISGLDPDVIVWSLGLTSFLHQNYPDRSGRLQVGVFSSPIYSLSELVRLGVFSLAANFSLSGIPLLGALSRRRFLRKRAGGFKLDRLVTQTATTRRRLVNEIWCGMVEVIPPGVDEIWLKARGMNSGMRTTMGLTRDDCVLVYFGPPARLRGLHLLVHAMVAIHKERPEVRLLILNRRRDSQFAKETAGLLALIKRLKIEDSVVLVDSFLERASLVDLCSMSDIVVLPFELISSDAPLSVMETRALGKLLVSTRVGCIPELAGEDQVFLCEPGSVADLTRAILSAIGEAGAISAGQKIRTVSPRMRTWRQVGQEWSSFIESL